MVNDLCEIKDKKDKNLASVTINSNLVSANIDFLI